MHSIVLSKKNTVQRTLIVYITEFFLKSGGQMHYCPPPPSKIWGAMAPCPLPPCGGPQGLRVHWEKSSRCPSLAFQCPAPQFWHRECLPSPAALRALGGRSATSQHYLLRTCEAICISKQDWLQFYKVNLTRCHKVREKVYYKKVLKCKISRTK